MGSVSRPVEQKTEEQERQRVENTQQILQPPARAERRIGRSRIERVRQETATEGRIGEPVSRSYASRAIRSEVPLGRVETRGTAELERVTRPLTQTRYTAYQEVTETPISEQVRQRMTEGERVRVPAEEADFTQPAEAEVPRGRVPDVFEAEQLEQRVAEVPEELPVPRETEAQRIVETGEYENPYVEQIAPATQSTGDEFDFIQGLAQDRQALMEKLMKKPQHLRDAAIRKMQFEGTISEEEIAKLRAINPKNAHVRDHVARFARETERPLTAEEAELRFPGLRASGFFERPPMTAFGGSSYGGARAAVFGERAFGAGAGEAASAGEAVGAGVGRLAEASVPALEAPPTFDIPLVAEAGARELETVGVEIGEAAARLAPLF